MARADTDWEAIEREYRAGVLSVREIARQNNLSYEAIRKHSVKHGWTRDLAARVKEEVDRRLLVDTEVDNPNVDPELIVDGVAKRNTGLLVCHRKDVNFQRGIVQLLASQLDEVAKGREEVAGTIEIETQEDNDTKRRNQMLKAISLPTHAGVARDLSVALKNLIPLERQAFGIDNGSTEEGSGVTVIIHRDGNPNSSADQAD